MNSNKSNIHLKGMWLCKAIPLVAILLIALNTRHLTPGCLMHKPLSLPHIPTIT